MAKERRNAERTGKAVPRRRRKAPTTTPDDMLAQVRGQVEPAFAFAVSYLRMLSEELGLGALAVWFGAEGLEQYVAASTREFEWRDELADLLRSATPLGPQGQSGFCTALRKNAEGDRRCHACDAKWIARARKSGRSWAYQCHAGLSEVVAPIVVNGRRIGEIMGGQIASTDALPGGFDNVWRRVRDIEGLDPAALEEAFASVKVVDKASLKRIRTRLQAAARALGVLIESVAGLMSREALLGHERSYLERDFAWFALTQPDATEETIGLRARTLGFTETPSVAIVAQPDRTSRATFGQHRSQTTAGMPALFGAAQRLLQEEPNSLVSSIRPGELVVLLSPARTRNPSLRRIRVEEFAAKLKKELESTCAESLLVGVSDCQGPLVSLARAYEEAHADAGRTATPKMADRSVRAGWLEQTAPRIAELGRTVRQTVRDGDREKFERAVEAQLRLVAECPEEGNEARLCLFTQMVLNVLSALEGHSVEARDIERVGTDYTMAMPTLQRASDMVEWFHAHLLPLVHAILLAPSSKLDRVVRTAYELTARRLSEPVGRDDVAQALGLSGTYFGKVFRERTGMPFRQFAKRLRAAKAQKLLLLPGKTVTEVASDVGYTTIAAFSRSFEQVCGASPCAYRNNPQAFARVGLPDGVEA
ncbi:MAG: helix-turn-helix domain-containing protein [bacterium]|nr:helix-turn-helix domain-containing protein [bacterium]